MKRLAMPIRVKLLLAVLLIVMVVMTLITLFMANVFHDDKTTYVRDLTSTMAVQVSREASVIVRGYTESLSTFGDVLFDDELGAGQKENLVRNLFSSFSGFIAVGVVRDGAEPLMVYDAAPLKAASLSADALTNILGSERPDPDELAGGRVHVANVTFHKALPMMTISLVHPAAPGSALVGFVELDRLMQLASRAAAYQTWITDSDARFLAHSDVERVYARASREVAVDRITLGSYQHALSTTLDFERDGERYIGGFARADVGDLNAGIEIPRSAAYLTARRLLGNLVMIALVIFSIATLVSLFIANRLTRPLERLTEAVRAIGKGDFDTIVATDSGDELGSLGESFNQMTAELRHRDEELQQANQALVQSEKMAAFGQLGAGIAHEVKNPLAGILGYAQLALRKVPGDSPAGRHLRVIEKETRRCAGIISNLLKFARREQTEVEQVSINDVVDDALEIVDHQLRINGVEIEKTLADDLPPIMGNANQLQQVLMNFAVNAQQAMKGQPGSLMVSTRLTGGDAIEIRVRDTGPGMSAEVRNRIFEPFFTTKPAGEGTGLGMSVSYGIVRDHGGDIQVESEPGAGACFVVTLPVTRREKTDLGAKTGAEPVM